MLLTTTIRCCACGPVAALVGNVMKVKAELPRWLDEVWELHREHSPGVIAEFQYGPVQPKLAGL